MTAFAELVSAAQQVSGTPKRGEKVALFAELLRRLHPDEVVAAIGFLIGEPRQGRIGVGWATMSSQRGGGATAPTLSVLDVDRALSELQEITGAGSQGARAERLNRLFAETTEAEQQHIFRVVTGEMRQGANEGVVTDAVAKAAARPLADVRRAAMLLGDLGITAHRALSGRSLDDVGLTTGVGVQPMLAATAATVTDALALTGPASVEWKLDGARVQVHRRGDDVLVYTRSLREISAGVPGIVAAVRALPVDDVVLDGEALGLDIDGNPLKFQDSMSGESRLRPFFFDLLAADGTSLIDEPLSDRKRLLAELVPSGMRLPTIDTEDAALAERFAADAVAAGHEGVMVKALTSPYQAGRRGATWRKVKPVHTLDLVVLAVEWGHGRRTGLLSNLHLGARGADGTFVMVGKTFKGMTDELLRWQTETFQRIAIGSEVEQGAHVVHVRPEVVVEIAVDGVQRSTRYPGGVALRFARVKRYREDKRAAEADTIERVQAML